jgi:hypothetical protein
MAKSYEQSMVIALRRQVEERLKNLPPCEELPARAGRGIR